MGRPSDGNAFRKAFAQNMGPRMGCWLFSVKRSVEFFTSSTKLLLPVTLADISWPLQMSNKLEREAATTIVTEREREKAS